MPSGLVLYSWIMFGSQRTDFIFTGCARLTRVTSTKLDRVMPMKYLQGLVDVERHPLNADSYAESCRGELEKKSILVLDNFLTDKALADLQQEAHSLHDKIFYCSQKHNVLLTEKNPQLDDNHPCNIEVVSDKGCVPHELIPPTSHLRTIYDSPVFQNFVQSVLSLDAIHPYADTLSSINYNYYEETRQLGWHFDNASFAITLMIQSPAGGGEFQYVADARQAEKDRVNVPLVDAVLHDRHPVEEVQVGEGTLVLFYGRNTLHRVTPVTSPKPRILATLNYNLEKNVELSENARLTFFGRLH